MTKCIICKKEFTPSRGMEKRQENCRSTPCLSAYRLMKERKLKKERMLAAENDAIQMFICHYPALN